MGGPTNNRNQAFSGGLGTANTAGAQSNQLYSTLFGNPAAPGGAGGIGSGALTGGTLSKMMDPNSLNISSPTGPYALQYNQAQANNAIGTDQNAQAITRSLGQHGFGSGAPSGLGEYLQSQNTQAGNTNKGNLFSQYAGQSYQDALNNFWKATGIASNTQQDAQKTAAGTYGNLYGTAQNAVNNSPGNKIVSALASPIEALGKAAGAKVGGKA
jgi:hypothetical protein